MTDTAEHPLTDMDKQALAILNKNTSAESSATPATPPAVVPPAEAKPTETPVAESQEQKEIEAYKATLSAPASKPEEKPDLTGLPQHVLDYITKIESKQPEVKEVIPQAIQEKLNTADKFLNKPLIKDLAEWLSEGDIDAKLSELFIRNDKDYAKATNDEILADYFKNIYPAPEDAVKVSQAIKDFKEINQKPFQIDEKMSEMRKILISKNVSKPSEKYQSIIEKNLTAEKQSRQELTLQKEKEWNTYQESIQAADKEVKELKEFKVNDIALPISDTDKAELIDFAAKHMPITRNGKEFKTDHKQGIDMALKVKYFDSFVKEARLKGYADAMRKYLKPNANESNNASAANTQKASMAELARQQYEKDHPIKQTA